MASGGIDKQVCINCRQWWPEPLVAKPVIGFCRREAIYDFANLAGLVHRTEALNVCEDFVARDAQEDAGSLGGFSDPASVIIAGNFA